MAKPLFCVRIAWDSDRHSPDWELQTEHPGFTNWMAPALFANGFTTPHPRVLQLDRGVLTLLLDTKAVLQLGGDGSVTVVRPAGGHPQDGPQDPRTTPGLAGVVVSAWQRGPEDGELVVVTCDAYRELRGATPRDLSRAGLDGRWRPASYEVLGPEGHLPVIVEVDDGGAGVTVRLDDGERAGDDDDDMAMVGFESKD